MGSLSATHSLLSINLKGLLEQQHAIQREEIDNMLFHSHRMLNLSVGPAFQPERGAYYLAQGAEFCDEIHAHVKCCAAKDPSVCLYPASNLVLKFMGSTNNCKGRWNEVNGTAGKLSAWYFFEGSFADPFTSASSNKWIPTSNDVDEVVTSKAGKTVFFVQGKKLGRKVAKLKLPRIGGLGNGIFDRVIENDEDGTWKLGTCDGDGVAQSYVSPGKSFVPQIPECLTRKQAREATTNMDKIASRFRGGVGIPTKIGTFYRLTWYFKDTELPALETPICDVVRFVGWSQSQKLVFETAFIVAKEEQNAGYTGAMIHETMQMESAYKGLISNLEPYAPWRIQMEVCNLFYNIALEPVVSSMSFFEFPNAFQGEGFVEEPLDFVHSQI